jgi:hypothetical protein
VCSTGRGELFYSYIYIAELTPARAYDISSLMRLTGAIAFMTRILEALGSYFSLRIGYLDCYLHGFPRPRQENISIIC